MAFPDAPSAEPVSDLFAQFLDAAHPKTARTGVMLSLDNIHSLSGSKHPSASSILERLGSAKADGRAITLPQGVLVLNSRDDAGKADKELREGKDPQEIIGKATGAGNGKQADQTAVVQGRTPEGATVIESMVRPADVAAKVEAVKADGKNPVVTTSDAAIHRRMSMLIAERLRQER